MDTHIAAPLASRTTHDDPTIWRVADALWAETQPLLMADKPRKKPGRPHLDDRSIVAGPLRLVRNGGRRATLGRRFGSYIHRPCR